MVTVPVKLQALTGDDQKGRCRLVVVDGAAQVGQRLVEAVMRTAVWHIGPQQASQGLA